MTWAKGLDSAEFGIRWISLFHSAISPLAFTHLLTQLLVQEHVRLSGANYFF
jgi:hypothetical protein